MRVGLFVPCYIDQLYPRVGLATVDVLERLHAGEWGLREVKSSNQVKKEYLDDVAVQRFVLAGAGARVPSAELVHMNRDYVLAEGETDWPALFTRADLTAESAGQQAGVPDRVGSFHDILSEPVEGLG